MTFGSWAYHGNEIDLGFLPDMEMLDISDLERESIEWEITSKSEERKIQVITITLYIQLINYIYIYIYIYIYLLIIISSLFCFR